MLNENFALSFNEAVLRPIKKEEMKYSVLYMNKLNPADELITKDHSHLIVSGSEASVLDNYPGNSELEKLIQNFIELNKPVLGICYGHQFIVRTILGKNHLRRSQTPEFGWAAINLSNNQLLKNTTRIISTVSHYDEVFNLTEDFKIFASSLNCAVHGFQYKNLPVWGIQFHPEYNQDEANEIFNRIKISDPEFPNYFINDLGDIDLSEDNENLIRNFCKVS